MLLKNFSNSKFEAGVDEAGRGSLAGPVFAAAVILPRNYKNSYLNDSKKISEKKRYELKKIIENDAVDYSIFFIDPKKIDEINILKATITAMHKAIDGLKTKPDFILIDGNRFLNYQNIEHKCIIKGDSKYLSIAAASILAKTYRDIYMHDIHKKFPSYEWNKNKGYGTNYHIKMIKEKGLTEFHRKTFKLKSLQLKIKY
tara:strand:+ start:9036 stop:9635 length:600 start_codon:yes stop_codon:yes gene_type:complete